MERFEISEEKVEEFRQTLKIGCIVIMCWIVQEGLCNQVFTDLLSSKDGNVFGERRCSTDEQVVDLYFTSNDLLYADSWNEPRFGSGAYNIMFKAIFEEQYGFAPKFHLYGKPYTLMYDFVERRIQKVCTERNVQISTFYMIGDNTQSDIEGAKRQG